MMDDQNPFGDYEAPPDRVTTSASRLISSLVGTANSIPVPTLLLEMLNGDYAATILCAQLIYWQDRSKTGWVYKTYKEWHDETWLGKKAVMKAAAKLRSRGWLETTVKKARGSPTVHYRFHLDRFVEDVISYVQDR